jgi:hypothetical protein
MITRFGKRFITSYLAGLNSFSKQDLAIGIADNTDYALADTNSRLGFEFYRLPATLSSVDIRSANITGATGNGTIITYIADNNFSVDQTIKITGISPSQYNI